MRLLILLCITIGAISCSSDKEDVTNVALIGQWKLTSFVDEKNETTLMPDDFENSEDILIQFEEQSRFTGDTSSNEFFGRYVLSTSKTVLIFIDLFSSEAGEPAWGNLFFDNLRLNYNLQTENYQSELEIQDNNFKLYYSETAYMLFERL